ncbi:hypothetical protein IG631_13971 [Alternaria alternata]|nr:hypothetical protein IG631_13971 [Alternaria alternata]
MASPHGPTPGGWSFDAQRGTYYQYDAQKRQYVYADGLIVPQTRLVASPCAPTQR